MTKNINKIIVVGLIATLGMISTASAKDGGYIGGNLAYVKQGDLNWDDGDDSGGLAFDNGIGISVLGGLKKNGMRFELEYLTHKNDFSDGDGDLKFNTIFLGAYKKFGKESATAPIFGASIGSTKLVNDDGDETTTAIQIGGGVDGKINNNLSFVAMLKLIKYNDFESDGDDVSFDMTIAVQGGIRYSF